MKLQFILLICIFIHHQSLFSADNHCNQLKINVSQEQLNKNKEKFDALAAAYPVVLCQHYVIVHSFCSESNRQISLMQDIIAIKNEEMKARQRDVQASRRYDRLQDLMPYNKVMQAKRNMLHELIWYADHAKKIN